MLPFLPQNAWFFSLKSKNGVLEIFLKSNILCTKILGTVKFFLKSKNFLKSNVLKSKIHCTAVVFVMRFQLCLGWLKWKQFLVWLLFIHELCCLFSMFSILMFLKSFICQWDHPFQTSGFLRGEGSKICQICRQIVLKNCRR